MLGPWYQLGVSWKFDRRESMPLQDTPNACSKFFLKDGVSFSLARMQISVSTNDTKSPNFATKKGLPFVPVGNNRVSSQSLAFFL
jgi:hypothetical protein